MSISVFSSAERVQVPAAGLALAGVVALWVVGSLPIAVNLVSAPWDKLAHAAVYAVLSCAIGLASGRDGARLIAVGFLGAMAIGLADELLQFWAAGRQADVEDLMADAVGAALGTLPLAVLVHLRQTVREHDHPLSSG
jgi:VanZ family protein